MKHLQQVLMIAAVAVPALWAQAAGEVRPALATDQVREDADDPAIWVHPSDPQRSLILGTDKAEAGKGAVYVFGLDGKVRGRISGLDGPNNIDVEYNFLLGGGRVDIAVVTERNKSRLRVFRIARDGSGLTDVSSLDHVRVFAQASGERALPMGVGLYRRARDGAVFAIVSPKSGPREGYLEQYRLEDDGAGRVRAVPVRRFGRFSGRGEIEAVAVDDALGYVYYADEGEGIHKYHADPDHPDAARELAHFGRSGFVGDREGIAIYARDDRTGYVVCTDQVAGGSRYHIYRREGAPGNPHDHSELLKIVRTGADETDGIEVTSAALGPHFPVGLMVAMNSSPRNFLIFRWEEVAYSGASKLELAKARGSARGAAAKIRASSSYTKNGFTK